MPSPEPQFTPNTIYSNLLAFPDGMNSGVAPLLLPSTQLAFASNATIRSTFIHPRPSWMKITLDFAGNTALQNAVTKALFQGAAYYRPDTGPETLVAQIGGRLFQFTPDFTTNTATVLEITIPGDPNSATLTQAWLWQAEKYLIVNNGVARPIFFDGVTSRRSISPTLQQVTQNGKLASPLTISVPVGGTVNLVLDSPFAGGDGDIIIVGNVAQIAVANAMTGLTNISGINLNVKPPSSGVFGSTTAGVPAFAGTYFAAGTPVTYFTSSTTIGELPPGRMGVYVMGRNWMSLPDGKQFIASDLVGGSSGTVAENFRDAVLKISENTYLAGGGNFTIPGSFGEIRAMAFVAVLDASLGQGPVVIFTPTHIFTCQSPVLRTAWQDVTNPILSVALIGNGATGQNSTVQANDDTIFRSLIGIHSLKLARLEFDKWGNVPINREVERVTDLDDEDLLPFASAVNFDNRMLMTTRPTAGTLGVYHQGLIALNFDPLSTIRGKLPSVYDGSWPGLNALQLITGEFTLKERCLSFTYNVQLNQIELWNVLKSKDTIIADNNVNPIFWWFEGPVQRWTGEDPVNPKYKQLLDGEIHVDDLRGRVDFQIFYRPDEWPCWIPWFAWGECAATGPSSQAQFRPQMGFGQPSSEPCDEVLNRPFREAFRFQIKVVLQGHCRVLGIRLKAITLPEPTFPPPECNPLCTDVFVTPS